GRVGLERVHHPAAMNRRPSDGSHPFLAPLLVTLLAAGCARETGTPSRPTFPSPPPTTSVRSDHSDPPDAPRFRFDCATIDGRSLPPLTSLDEVWAAPDYLQIESCAVLLLGADPGLLPTEEAAVEVAAPETSDPLVVVEDLLSTCTRLPPEGGPHTLPSPTLRAALIICPDAPHADLMRDELASRGEKES
ncbi:hypothetical protein, partial [Ornithinimicrobium kibberense]